MAPGSSAPLPVQAAPPTGRPSPPPSTSPAPSKVHLLNKAQNDVGGISLPKFTNDTGAVVMLVVLNMAWTVFRSFAENPTVDNTLGAASPLHPQLVKVITGTWVVGLGLLIVHEVDPHVAMLLALLFVIGNVLSNNAGNKAVVAALSTVFAGNKSGYTGSPGTPGGMPIVGGATTGAGTNSVGTL